MDYTKIPRSIIYMDIKDIGDFDIDNESVLMGQFFNSMLDQTFMSEHENSEEILLAVFNNAFYICTLICLEKRPRMYLQRYLSIASAGKKGDYWEYNIMPSTMALVYSLLICSGKYTVEDKFMCSIWNNFKDWDLYNDYCYGKDCFYSQIFTSYKLETIRGYEVPGRPLPMYIRESFQFKPREIITLFTIDSYVKDEDIVDGIDYILHEILENKNEEEREWILPSVMGHVVEFYDQARIFDNKPQKRKGVRALMKIHDAYTKVGLEWKSPYADDDSSERDDDQTNMETEDAERNTLVDSASYESRIKELEEENKQLKNTPHAQIEDDEVKRITQEKEEMTIELLLPVFYNIEQDVKEFLNKIHDRQDTEIIDTVCEFLKARKISDKSKGRPLWSVLHAAKYYSSTESNWNTALRNHPK